jgi:hypothetical protein
MKLIIPLLMITSLSGCATLGKGSLDFKNAGKTVTTTAVTYVAAGPIPAILNLGTSMAYDEIAEEISPEGPNISEIESGNKEQMIAYLWSETKELILYGIIALLIFTNVIGPWAAQRRAKRKMKYDQYKVEAKASRIMKEK